MLAVLVLGLTSRHGTAAMLSCLYGGRSQGVHQRFMSSIPLTLSEFCDSRSFPAKDQDGDGYVCVGEGGGVLAPHAPAAAPCGI